MTQSSAAASATPIETEGDSAALAVRDSLLLLLRWERPPLVGRSFRHRCRCRREDGDGLIDVRAWRSDPWCRWLMEQWALLALFSSRQHKQSSRKWARDLCLRIRLLSFTRTNSAAAEPWRWRLKCPRETISHSASSEQQLLGCDDLRTVRGDEPGQRRGVSGRLDQPATVRRRCNERDHRSRRWPVGASYTVRRCMARKPDAARTGRMAPASLD